MRRFHHFHFIGGVIVFAVIGKLLPMWAVFALMAAMGLALYVLGIVYFWLKLRRMA